LPSIVPPLTRNGSSLDSLRGQVPAKRPSLSFPAHYS
jgi:hypothetical protein